MKTLELDTTLDAPTRNDWEIKDSAKKMQNRHFLFPADPNAHALMGFIEYICFCYQKHYTAVISPTDIMYMVQCELATAVKNNPIEFASLFTTTPGTKQEIVTLTGNVEEVDVYAVVDALRERVPTNVDMFLPEFSTNTLTATLATHVAFCDMVSPYYSYSTMLCGIPTVIVSGSLEDWKKLAATLFDLTSLFKGNLRDYITRVWTRVTLIIKECKTGNGDLFREMVQLKKCGSGSQYDVTGWILEFMNTKDKPPIMLQNVHQHISKMEYKNLETSRTFELYAGIFYTELRTGVAMPIYNACRIETTEGGKKKKLEKTSDDFTLVSSPVVSKTRKVKGNWTPSEEEDEKIFRGVDTGEDIIAAIQAAMEKKSKS